MRLPGILSYTNAAPRSLRRHTPTTTHPLRTQLAVDYPLPPSLPPYPLLPPSIINVNSFEVSHSPLFCYFFFYPFFLLSPPPLPRPPPPPPLPSLFLLHHHLSLLFLLLPPSSFSTITSYCSSSSSASSSFLPLFPSPSTVTVMNTLLIPQHSTFPNNYFLITQFNVRFIVYPERQIKGVMSWYSKHLHVHMELVDFQRKARQQT